jgi:protein-tyrosine phosphatase
MSGYIDLHAHHLAGVDDGAPDWDTAVRMVAGLVDLGFAHLYTTPHQRSGLYLPDLALIERAFDELRRLHPARPPEGGAGPGSGSQLAMGLGAENFWDEILLQRIQTGTIPSYDGGPAFLFEVNPQMMPTGLETTLFELRLRDKLPVLAHPERYLAIQKQIERARTIGRSAALLVDLAALDGAHGKQEMRTARLLLTEGLAHAVASDIHSPDDLPDIAAGMAWIRKHLGEGALDRLLTHNPRRILAGELPDPVT